MNISQPKLRREKFDDDDNNNNSNNNNNNTKATFLLINTAISGDRNMIKTKKTENTSIYKDLTTEIQRKWNVKNRSDTSSNRGKWNHPIIIQEIHEQYTGKARHQGNRENSHI